MSKPRVSLLCYFRNEEAYLGAMIQSAIDAIDMCPVPVEMVLLDNGSTDKSREIAHSFADQRIRHLDFDDDISGPENDFAHENDVGFDACEGDLIAIIGGDDLILPDRLARQVAFFEADPLLDIAHSGAWHIDENHRLLNTFFESKPYHQWNFLRIAFTYCGVAYPTAMIRKSSWEQAGKFADYGYCPDFGLWLNTARDWRYRYDPERLIYYRIHDKSASHSPEGSRRCSIKTVEIRAQVRARYGIEDFFPEIALCADQTAAKAAAHLELGNMMMGGGMANIQLAFDEYKLADQLLPDHPAIVHNASVVMALDSQIEAAKTSLESIPASPLVDLTKLVVDGMIRQPFSLADGKGICPELYSAKLPPGLWKSDGTLTC